MPGASISHVAHLDQIFPVGGREERHKAIVAEQGGVVRRGEHPTIGREHGYGGIKQRAAEARAFEPVVAAIEALTPRVELTRLLDSRSALGRRVAAIRDTNRRDKDLKAAGLRFIGTGVSGGEEGALKGPSIMPGGSSAAWPYVKEIFQGISAKVDGGAACCDWVGGGGSGHYVKMVHNGIEYGDMQMICEAYDLMRGLLGMTPDEIGSTFEEWNKGDLNSFLIEITAKVLKQKDPETGVPLVDVILDTAGQKGTGKWTSANALDMGVAAPTIAEAVFARCLSAVKDERVAAAKALRGPKRAMTNPDKAKIIEQIRDALYCSKICSYSQGFQLMREAQNEYKWKLNFGEIAQIWRGGCIIRARFLQKITEAFGKKPRLANLLLDPYFKKTVKKAQKNWRKVIALAVKHGIPVPTLGSALSYFDSYRTEDLPQNLLQGQRDFFGAHTYERKDKPRGEFFHIDWPDPKRPQIKA